MKSKPIGHRGIGASGHRGSLARRGSDRTRSSSVAIVAIDRPKIDTEARPPIKDQGSTIFVYCRLTVT